MLLYGATDRVAAFVANVIGQDISWGRDIAAIGVMRNSELVAGVVYSHFTGFDIQLSMAATTPRWATKQAIGSFLSYPYDQLGCVRTTLITSVNNLRTQKLVLGLGYKTEGTLRLGWCGTEDALILGALRSDVEKWLNG